MGYIVLNSFQALMTNLIGVGVATFFLDGESLAPDIHVVHIELRHGPSSHARLNEGIDHGPVAIGAIAFASGPLAGFIALPITRESADGEEQISGIKQLAALGGRDGSFHLESHANGWELQLGHRISQGEWPELVDPLGEGFEVGHDPEQGFVTPDSAPLVIDRLLHVPLKVPGEPWRPRHPVIRAFFGRHVVQEQRQITALHFLGREARGHLEAEILLGPPVQPIRHIFREVDERRLTVSYGDLGESRPVIVRHIGVAGVTGSFFTVVEVAIIITLWPWL